jgi:nitrite reductase (NADH) small subunit
MKMNEAMPVGQWRKVCPLTGIPKLGARVVKTPVGDVAVFRNAEDEVFALHDKCPHKGGPLSQGIVFGRNVSCPLHGWTIRLEDGHATAPDEGCTRQFQVKVEAGEVYLQI